VGEEVGKKEESDTLPGDGAKTKTSSTKRETAFFSSSPS
jgi:hypothetical protein